MAKQKEVDMSISQEYVQALRTGDMVSFERDASWDEALQLEELYFEFFDGMDNEEEVGNA